MIARSGASTVAELSVIGRPAVLVPLPHSLESDQLKNAESFAAAGGGWIREQGPSRPPTWPTFLTHLRYAAEDLPRPNAASARRQGPDAAERLADLVERLARDAKATAQAGAGESAATMERTRAMKLPREIGPIHFIGIGGIGMSGIAEVMDPRLCGSGIRPRRQRQCRKRCRKLGIPVEIGHRGENPRRRRSS